MITKYDRLIELIDSHGVFEAISMFIKDKKPFETNINNARSSYWSMLYSVEYALFFELKSIALTRRRAEDCLRFARKMLQVEFEKHHTGGLKEIVDW